MLLKYISKNMRRSALTNALFCLLLALAGTLLSLASGLWISVYMTERNLDENITTIAFPDMSAVYRYAGGIARDVTLTLRAGKNLAAFYDAPWWTDSWYVEVIQHWGRLRTSAGPDIHESTYTMIAEDFFDRVLSTDLLDLDERRVYGAYSPDAESVPFLLSISSGYGAIVENSPQSIAAFVVKCTGVEDIYSKTSSDFIFREYIAHFEVEQDVFLHNGRYPAKTVTGYFPYANPDGSAPVEAGKRYFVVGYNYSQAETAPSWSGDVNSKSSLSNAFYVDILGKTTTVVRSQMVDIKNENDKELAERLKDELDVSFAAAPVGIFTQAPLFSQALGYEGQTWFELDGSLEDALASPEGEHIKAALSVAEVSYNSLTVLTTGNLNSLYNFNQYKNRVINGRAFTASEAADGARVCVISELLAELNGLSVGDELALCLYPTTLGQVPGANNAWAPNPYHPGLELSEPLAYTIVGIYSGPAYEAGDQSVSANTVIIPNASFDGFAPDAALFQRLGSDVFPPLLDAAVIVPNGQIKETKALIDNAAKDYSGFFRFHDQGYSMLKYVLANLRLGMSWILILASAGWAVAVMIFLLFYARRKSSEISLLYCIGVSRIKNTLWVFVQCALIAVIAQGIALATSLMLFEGILDTTLTAFWSVTEGFRDFTLSSMNIAGGARIVLLLDTSTRGLMIVAAGMTVLLLVVSFILSARLSKQRWQSRMSKE